MPRLEPSQIHNVLRETSLARREPDTKESLEELLDKSNLGREEVLNTIGDLMRCSDTSAVRLNAAKIAAQMHGLVNNEAGVSVPSVTIIIRDSEFSLNPILIPRS